MAENSGKDIPESTSELDSDEISNTLELESIELEGLSIKKNSLIGYWLFSLLSFIIILFPIEEILRSILVARTEKSGIHIGFKKINFPYFGLKTIDSLYVLTKDNIEFKAEEVNFTINPYQIWNRAQVISTIESFSNNLEMCNMVMNARSLNLDINLTNTDRENLVLNGSIGIHLTGGNITRLPEILSFLGVSEIKVKMIQMNLKITGNKILIEKGNFDISIAKIMLKGRIDISPVFNNSLMELEVCPKLSKEYAVDREDLQNMLLLYSKTGDPCFPIKGTIGNPRVDLNLMPQNGIQPQNPVITDENPLTPTPPGTPPVVPPTSE